MGKIRVVTGDYTEFYLDKLFVDGGFEFLNATFKENLYEGVATITMGIHCDQLPCKLNDVFTGALIDSYGNSISLNVFVDSMELQNKTGVIQFLCCSESFVKPIVTTKYKKIKDAIESTWGGGWRHEPPPEFIESDIMTMTDQDYFYYQMECTNKELCDKLIRIYRKDTLSGYTLSDLVHCDLNNWKNPIEVYEHRELSPIGSPIFNDPKFYKEDVKIKDYSKGKDPNHKILHYYSQEYLVDLPYVDVVGNYLYQRRYDIPKISHSFRMKKFKAWRLGQPFKIHSPHYDYKEMWLVGRVIEINDNHITTTLTFNDYK